MARTVIGVVPCRWSSGKGWEVDRACRYQLEQLQAHLDALAGQGAAEVLVTVEKARRPRTMQQNRLMWALLTIMAREFNAGRSGGTTPEDCYIDMLEEYGVRFVMLEAPCGAVDLLRRAYRVVKVVELRDGDRCTLKCGEGTSQFSTAEMREFLDGIFDRLAEMGVDDPEVTQYWREWRAGDLPPR